MASDLQIKLYQSNKDFEYLATLMSERVYPKLLMYMQKFGMEEIRFDGEFNNWKTFAITLSGKIQFFMIDKTDDRKTNIYELNFAGEKKCPLFYSEKNIKTYETLIVKYNNYCNVVLEKLEELESFYNVIQNTIKKIESLSIELNRVVIFEKTNQ